jgi:deoxycytidylate deaminase
MVSASIYDSSKRHISSGINNPTKSHPTQARYASMSGNVDKIFLHAEISALIKSIKTKKDPHTIVVVRVKKDGSFGTSKPCPVCQLAIEETSIKNVIYYDGYNFVMETRK